MNIFVLAFFLLFTVFSPSLLPKSQLDPKTEKAETAKIVFKSSDGGQTWQNISKGLLENLLIDNIQGNSFFANDNGLFLKVGNELYHSRPNATTPFWTKEVFSEKYSIAPGKSRASYWGVNLKKTDGTSVWSPVFDDSEPRMRSAFETLTGTIFIGTDRGLFKTTNNGETWKHVYGGGWAGHLAESNGVLVSTSKRSIIRSTDDGENWSPVISEDSVAFDLKPIHGGFVAITSNSTQNTVNTSRLSTSYDGGKTWQSIHSSLQDKVVTDSIGRTWNNRPRMQASQTAIIQVGENFFCTHPDGIFRSTDKGKTWKLLLPSTEVKVFNLFVSGKVIFATLSKGGC